MRPAVTAALLVLLAAAVRINPFLSGNDDGDVGAYVLGARELLHGVLPYGTVWEYKPPGLFAVYAGALALTGDGSHASAVLGLLAAVATTLLLWRFVAEGVPDGEGAGVMAGVLWACGSVEFDGLRGDAELLVIPFIAAAVWIAARSPARAAVVVAGLLAGCALQMKLSAAPVALVPAAAAVVRSRRAAVLAPFLAGFALPIVVDVAVYAAAGRLAALWDVNVGATLRRIAARTGSQAAPHDALTEVRRLAPGLLLAPFAFGRRVAATRIVLLWLVLAAVTCIAIGEYDDRQFLSLLAPLAALGGIGFGVLAQRLQRPAVAAASIGLLAFALHGYYETVTTVRTVWMRAVWGDRDWHRSEGERIADRLRARRLNGADVWLLEITPLLYDALRIRPPSRYVVTSNLLDRSLWPMLGFSGRDELWHILARSRPQWIVAKRYGEWCDARTRDELQARIAARYDVVEQLDGFTTLYRRRGESPAGTAF